ncbi:unnamed protein product [Ceutorhynchus assimilis]|uniref:Uncharacterized protein n=1 Tax=Ceutorhynchus assimilis TaxID=467358 RepID=A0A9N9MUF6_9CUCU|nr:unnamed protein product [Ceutorhynchus assimilis]
MFSLQYIECIDMLFRYIMIRYIDIFFNFAIPSFDRCMKFSAQNSLVINQNLCATCVSCVPSRIPSYSVLRLKAVSKVQASSPTHTYHIMFK